MVGFFDFYLFIMIIKFIIIIINTKVKSSSSSFVSILNYKSSRVFNYCVCFYIIDFFVFFVVVFVLK